MSIQDEIKARLAENRLVEYEPLAPMSINRPIFLIPEVSERIVSPLKDEAVEMAYVRADLDNFVGEGTVHLAFSAGPKNANFRRLHDKKRKSRKVWEMRTLSPKPGYRLFGLFAAQDVFVGVDLIPRDMVDFEGDISRAKNVWQKLFGTYEPLVSEDINDYVSEKLVFLRGT